MTKQDLKLGVDLDLLSNIKLVRFRAHIKTARGKDRMIEGYYAVNNHMDTLWQLETFISVTYKVSHFNKKTDYEYVKGEELRHLTTK